jgi:hypothetical protein
MEMKLKTETGFEQRGTLLRAFQRVLQDAGEN